LTNFLIRIDMTDNEKKLKDYCSKTISAKLSAILPILVWLPKYKLSCLGGDLIAGLTLAAYAIPVAMAYAALAGLPPQTGLYCYIFSGFAYVLFATSRHLAIGPTAAISVMVASVIGNMAGGDPILYAAMASMTAAIVALMYLIAWILRLSSFVNFISETILLGFKAGAALSIASTQLPVLFGLQGGGDNFFTRIIVLSGNITELNPLAFLIGMTGLCLLIAGEWFLPGRPVALAVVILAIIITSLFELSGSGVQVLGVIPSGLPSFRFTDFGTGHFESLLELAFACFLLSYVESVAAARTFAAKYNYSVDPHQELLGLGAANLISAIGQGYPVAGGLSQSAVNEKAGANSPLSLVFASSALLLVALYLTGLLHNLPQSILAAIVLVAVSGFIKINEFKYLWSISRLEFNVALVAFFAVLFTGILKGVAISAIISILFLLRMMAKPHVAVLGRIPGTIRFSDAARHTKNEIFPGLFLFRVEAPLLYFNVDFIRSTLINKVLATNPPVRLVVCDLSTSPYIDAAGAKMLAQLEVQLDKNGIDFRVAEAHSTVREILRNTGISERLGGVSRHTALADIVEDFERDNQRAAARWI
jgi:sulfate permease, SulP family